MGNIYITDTDFIDREIWLNEESYNLIYGILYSASFDDYEEKDGSIYNVVQTMVANQYTTIVAKIKVRRWITLYESIISKLKSFSNLTLVTVPFINLYDYKITNLILDFEMAKDILIELQEVDLEPDVHIDGYRVFPDSIEELFSQAIKSGVTFMNDSNELLKSSEIEEIFKDELIRRGLSNDEPSKNFDKNLYEKFVYDGNKAVDYGESVDDEIVNKKDSPKAPNAKYITGVVYFLLKQHLQKQISENQISEKEIDDITLHIVSFITKSDGDKNNDSVRRYLSDKENALLTVEYKELITKQLKRFKVAEPLPEELKTKEIQRF